MAKISANGDREVARVRCVRGAFAFTFVLTAKGRLLRKMDGASGYTLVKRGIPEHGSPRQFLEGYVLSYDYKII